MHSENEELYLSSWSHKYYLMQYLIYLTKRDQAKTYNMEMTNICLPKAYHLSILGCICINEQMLSVHVRISMSDGYNLWLCVWFVVFTVYL